jgi:hypothetical protein
LAGISGKLLAKLAIFPISHPQDLDSILPTNNAVYYIDLWVLHPISFYGLNVSGGIVPVHVSTV